MLRRPGTLVPSTGQFHKMAARQHGVVILQARQTPLSRALRRSAHPVLDSPNVAAAEALHLAAEFEVAADLRVVQNAEAVDDGDRPARLRDDRVGIEIEVGS